LGGHRAFAARSRRPGQHLFIALSDLFRISLFVVAKGLCATRDKIYGLIYMRRDITPLGGLKSLRRTEASRGGASANSMRPARASISLQSGLLLQWFLSQPPPSQKPKTTTYVIIRPHTNSFGPPAFSALGGRLLSGQTGCGLPNRRTQIGVKQKSRRTTHRHKQSVNSGFTFTWPYQSAGCSVLAAGGNPAPGEGDVPPRRKGAQRRGHSTSSVSRITSGTEICSVLVHLPCFSELPVESRQ
jgi:hypothetical protein